jgi:hypothetical protein
VRTFILKGVVKLFRALDYAAVVAVDKAPSGIER